MDDTDGMENVLSERGELALAGAIREAVKAHDFYRRCTSMLHGTTAAVRTKTVRHTWSKTSSVGGVCGSRGCCARRYGFRGAAETCRGACVPSGPADLRAGRCATAAGGACGVKSRASLARCPAHHEESNKHQFVSLHLSVLQWHVGAPSDVRAALLMCHWWHLPVLLSPVAARTKGEHALFFTLSLSLK